LYNERRPEEYQGDEFVTEKEFHELRSELFNSQFTKNRSPWEVILVHYVLPEDQTLKAKLDRPPAIVSVMLCKSQHSVGDGFSFKRILLGQLLQNRKNSSDEVQPEQTKTKPTRHRGSFCYNCINFVQNIWTALIFPLRSLYEWILINIQLNTNKSDWHVPENKQAPAVHAFTNIISLSRVKMIKDQCGVSLSTLLFHICNEAMQKMMERKGMRLQEYVVTIFPLPLPNHPAKLRNHM